MLGNPGEKITEALTTTKNTCFKLIRTVGLAFLYALKSNPKKSPMLGHQRNKLNPPYNGSFFLFQEKKVNKCLKSKFQ